MVGARCRGCVFGVGLLWLASSAHAEPMQLADATPRWVMVQFEDSPNDRPEALDRVYTKPFAAWLQPDSQGRITVRVDAEVLEKSLFFEHDPVPGSFSDYLWVFDPRSGEVLEAVFDGAFHYAIDWGIATTRIEAQVEARMQTTTAGGFRGPEPIWGRPLHLWCVEPGEAGCRSVERSLYDAERGYVNAIGYLAIDSPVTRFMTFSAVGEARFSELPGDVAVTPLVEAGARPVYDTAEQGPAAMATHPAAVREAPPARRPVLAP